jgi:iron(III) transport system substrate-binding protein
MKQRALGPIVAAVAVLGLMAAGCGRGEGETLTIYAGRSQQLVQPLLEQFSKDTGIAIRVRYGDGTDLALGILEEGANSPADVYYTQDVGALSALKAANRLTALPESTLDKVPAAFRAQDGRWVGITGRARVVVYNTDKIDPKTLPPSILDYTNAQWKDRLGIVPRSDGFPEFVTALRLTRGQEFARAWLTDLKANSPRTYPNNLAALQAVASNEIDVAFLNHYYVYRLLAERGEGFKARNYYFTNGDIGGLFVISGAAILDTAKNRSAAEQFINYMLSAQAQRYFSERTQEYPMVEGIETSANLPALSQLRAPDVDLTELTDLQGSLELMRQTGILP